MNSNGPHEYINRQYNCIYHADALVEWFESGVGHQVWRTVRSEHAHVFQPMLTPRKHENMSNATKRKRTQSTGPVKPTWNGSHSHIKASKARQQQAAEKKTLRDAMLFT